ncbi:MAG: gamma-glutamyl-gamma-aminobutyrate hydrolase family protein [Polyangia bacterium]|jgi:GMP synthase-like glutamine amidotransferase
MKRAIILQHMQRESAGSIAEACARRGLTVEVRNLDEGARVPESCDALKGAVVIVMGGSMGVADVGDPRYPFLERELHFLRRALEARQPVLGVCLGAQLLAAAAGSRVYPNRSVDGSPALEVGFGEVRLVGGGSEPALAGLGERLLVLHWHGDTFDLPPSAIRLAQSERCANQAFRIGSHAYGLQFHVETDAATVRRWAKEDAEFATRALGPGGPAAIIADSEAKAMAMSETGQRLIDNILGQLASSEKDPGRVL